MNILYGSPNWAFANATTVAIRLSGVVPPLESGVDDGLSAPDRRLLENTLLRYPDLAASLLDDAPFGLVSANALRHGDLAGADHKRSPMSATSSS